MWKGTVEASAKNQPHDSVIVRLKCFSGAFQSQCLYTLVPLMDYGLCVPPDFLYEEEHAK